jgi:hypothetical protein
MAYNYTGTFDSRLKSPIQDIATKTEQELRAKGMTDQTQIEGSVQKLIDMYRTPQYSQDGTPIKTGGDLVSNTGESAMSEADWKAKYMPTIDENKIRQDILERRQAQIDATNEVYNRLISAERAAQQQLGKERLGSTKALLGRSQLMGSGRGQAQISTTKEYSAKAEEAGVGILEAKRNAEIQSIFGDIDKSAVERAEAEYIKAKEGADAYVKYLTDLQTKNKTNLTNAALAGMTWDQIKSAAGDKLQSYLENMGFTNELDAKNYFDATKATNTKKVEPMTETVNGILYERQTDGTWKAMTQAGVDTKAPEVREVGGSLYQYNSKTGGWDLAVKKPAGAPPSDTKDETAFYKDIGEQLEKLQTGKADWGEAFNLLKAKWGTPDDILDSLLNKPKWSEPGAYNKYNPK